MTEPFSGTINYWILQMGPMMLTALLIPKLRITSLLGTSLTVLNLVISQHGRNVDWVAMIDRAITVLESARERLRDVPVDATPHAAPQ